MGPVGPLGLEALPCPVADSGDGPGEVKPALPRPCREGPEHASRVQHRRLRMEPVPVHDDEGQEGEGRPHGVAGLVPGRDACTQFPEHVSDRVLPVIACVQLVRQVLAGEASRVLQRHSRDAVRFLRAPGWRHGSRIAVFIMYTF